MLASLALVAASAHHGGGADWIACQPSLYAPACSHEVARAGHPGRVWPWAIPGGGCDYTGYYVGGGAYRYWHFGRCQNQGTWGWDYTGNCVPPLVRLGWWPSPRPQGGTGSYAPDGPRILEQLHEQ